MNKQIKTINSRELISLQWTQRNNFLAHYSHFTWATKLIDKILVIPSSSEPICSTTNGLDWVFEARGLFPYGSNMSCVSVRKNFIDDSLVFAVRTSPSTASSVYTSIDGKNWTLKTDSPPWPARGNTNLVSVNNVCFLMGGIVSGGYLNDVWASYDFGENWVEISSPGERWSGRSEAAVVYFNDKIWVMGGFNGTPLNDIWVSEHLGQDWNKVTNNAPWDPRQGHRAVVFNDKIWVMGGRTGWGIDDEIFNDIWYTSDGISWVKIPNDTPWMQRSDFGCVSYDSKIWVIGGDGRDTSYPLTLYDTWTATADPLSTSSNSSQSSSISEWEEQIQDFVSLNIDPNTGNPIIVAQGEKQHIALYKINNENTDIISYKVLPKSVISGDVFVNLGENSILPFSWDSVSSKSEKTDLPFSFNMEFEEILKEPDSILFSGNKNSNIILPKNKIDISTHLKNIDVEVWSGDQSGTQSLKIGSVTNMPFEEFNISNTSFNSPVFSWENNVTIPQERFILGKNNGNIELYNFKDSSNDMVLDKVIYGQNSPILNSSINGIVRGNKGFYYSSNKNGIIKISSIELLVNNFAYDINSPIISCIDEYENSYVIINDGNDILKLTSDFNKYYINGFSSLLKLLWSTYHQSLITCGRNSITVYKNKKITINESETNVFYDADVNKDGIISVLLSDGSDSIIKVLNRDYSLRFNLKISNFITKKCLFDKKGYLFVIAENNDNYTVFIVNLSTGNLTKLGSIKEAYSLSSFVYNSTLDSFFIFYSNGTYIRIKNKGENTLKELKECPRINVDKRTEITFASIANQLIGGSGDFKQVSVRVFVGSKSGQNDKWDSGEIKTEKTAILYGGGNNLMPGYKYYVHILTCYEEIGWGNAQIMEFIVPK